MADQNEATLDLLLGVPAAAGQVARDHGECGNLSSVSTVRKWGGRAKVLSFIAVLSSVALIGVYFWFEDSALVTRDNLQAARSALTSKAIRDGQELDEAHARADVLTSELTATRLELNRLALATKAGDNAEQLRQGEKSAIAELEKSLQQERARSASLTSELSTVRQDLETKLALATKAGDNAEQLRQGEKSAIAELEKSLQQERAGSASLTSELSTVRQDLETKLALATKAGDIAEQLSQGEKSATAELAKSLQQERARSASLTSELSTARRDLETKLALSTKTSDVEAQRRETILKLSQSLQREREEGASLRRDLESARHIAEASATFVTSTKSQVLEANPTPDAAKSAAIDIKNSPEVVDRLMARGSALVAQGNIGAARTVFERAVEAGIASASFALAETYDPQVLSRWGTYGTRGDTSKARELYAKALDGGIQRAGDRLKALPR